MHTRSICCASVIALWLVSSCSKIDEKLQSEVANYHSCINAPESVLSTYKLANEQDSPAIYLSEVNLDKFDESTWYLRNKQFFDDAFVSWGLENWKTLSSLENCDPILNKMENDFPKAQEVLQLREYRSYLRETYTQHANEQNLDANLSLGLIVYDARDCLWLEEYPQVFISVESYEAPLAPSDITVEHLYPANFTVPWDGSTFNDDGTFLLGRPINEPNSSTCLETYSKLDSDWIEHALDGDVELPLISFQDHQAFLELMSTTTKTVKTYNGIVDEELNIIKRKNGTVPEKSSYVKLIIYRINNGYLTDYISKDHLEGQLQRCLGEEVKTWFNEIKEQTLYSFPPLCTELNALCEKEVDPSLYSEFCPALEEKLSLPKEN